ncbi:Holliday junction resolvase RuvX [Candidatus Parcubacteria bacterium]|nr:Holliday junction resolvase RuvX [Candidatus Parcubacteria bacterium]
MAIDFGEKRVGIASTDEEGQFALPRVVIENSDSLVDEVERLADDWKTEKIIIGESKDFKGNPNTIHAPAKDFATLLKKRGRVVEFHPELLTSMEAERLQGHNDMHDASAAALILKSYIDTHQ